MPESAGAIAAQLGSDPRKARVFKLTIDNTLRTLILPAGGWRIYGCATQVYYMSRLASDAAGTLCDGETAPAITDVVASTAGTPTAAKLWQDGTVSLADNALSFTGFKRGASKLTLDVTTFKAISVPLGQFVVLYMLGPSALNCELEGPFR